MQPIYLDYNATTPVDPRVVDAMLPYLREHFGNPSSNHPYGIQAHAGIDTAREQVASLLGCAPDEIVFTGGGSESDNLAIKGVAEAYQERGNHIITSQIEHPAVLNTCRYLEQRGFQITYLPVDRKGRVDPNDVTQAITTETILVTLMHANNEVGTIQPLAAVSQIAREHGILFHTDAAQSVGKIPPLADDALVAASTQPDSPYLQAQDFVFKPFEPQDIAPTWRLDIVPAHDPEGAPLGYSAVCVVDFSDLAETLSPESPERGQWLEVAQFQTEERANQFRDDFMSLVGSDELGNITGPALAGVIADDLEMDSQWQMMSGQSLDALKAEKWSVVVCF